MAVGSWAMLEEMLGKNSLRSDKLTVEYSWLTVEGVADDEEEAVVWLIMKLGTGVAFGWGPRFRLSMILHVWFVVAVEMEGEASTLGWTEKS